MQRLELVPREEQPNVASLMKAKDDVRRAEQVVREQEKIIQKLEDLLERSMHTVDKRIFKSDAATC